MPEAKNKRTTAKKKTPAKTSRTTKKTTEEKPLKTSTGMRSAAYYQRVRALPKIYFIAILAIIIIGALLYIFRGQFIPATVNGEPITRMQVVEELEKQSGKDALNQLITKTLILQEARRRNVTVSDKEIDDQIKKIRDDFAKQGQQLDQLLQAQNLTMADLREQIKIQQLINKMLGNVTVTDKEINDYINKNKDQIPQGEVNDQLKATIRDQIKSQKLNDKYQAWIQDLKNKAKINIWRNY